jgi:hypothetical protein
MHLLGTPSSRMSILQFLKKRFSPQRITDPDFGSLLYMHIPNAPERSYWECEWNFPRTGTNISISLPGDEDGPWPESREFYFEAVERFDQILAAVRPKLDEVFIDWLQQELPEYIFSVVRLAGFDLQEPREQPVKWEISFETTGKKWLCISIPFEGEMAGNATVDT